MLRVGFGLGTFVLLVLLGLVPGPSAQAATPREQTAVHRVGKGESLSRISRSYGCRIADLQAANHMGERTVIYPGERLEIPNCGPGSQGTKSSKGSKSPKNVEELVRHRVRKGESLSRIAQRYGCSPNDIRTRNNLRGNMIHPGMELVVPRGRGGKAAIEVKKGQSVGKPHRGSLTGGVQLPSDRSYYRRRTARAYGASHTVEYTRQAIATVRARYPKIHRLAIGDLSHSGGGALSGHRSHQSGRDVDVGLYYRRKPSGYPKEFVPGTSKNLHLGATWALVNALLATRKLAGGVEHIFLDYELQGLLYKYAKEQGVKRSLLAEVFQYPHGKGHGGALIQHVAAHHDHLHIRYKCPKGDSGCK